MAVLPAAIMPRAARKTRYSSEDAGVLVTLLQVFLSEPILKATRFWRTEIREGMSLEEFESRFPRGSDGYENFINLAVFWEVVGSLMRKGLVKEDLAFDTFLDAPPGRR